MKTFAEYDYEYYAFNEYDGFPVDYTNEYLFDTPVRIFGIGPNALVAAEAWVRDANKERAETRESSRVMLDVDRLSGRPVNLEVRRRLIIKLGYERIFQSDNPRLDANYIEDVRENWVPA